MDEKLRDAIRLLRESHEWHKVNGYIDCQWPPESWDHPMELQLYSAIEDIARMYGVTPYVTGTE